MPSLFPALSKLLVLVCGTCHVLGLPSATQTIDVSLKTGIFRGVVTPNGTDTFFGIPFAQPPVGSLRFKAPAPVIETSRAVKDASRFGNACPQPQLSTNLGAPIGESCLFLNVCVHNRYMSIVLTGNTDLEASRHQHKFKTAHLVLVTREIVSRAGF